MSIMTMMTSVTIGNASASDLVLTKETTVQVFFLFFPLCLLLEVISLFSISTYYSDDDGIIYRQ